MLQCAYCKRNHRHGGECESINNNQGCLYFMPDEKGCIRRADLKVPFNLYSDIPQLDMWSDGWELYGNDTQLRIIRIYGLSWDKTKGLLYVHCSCEYYINEFSDGFIEDKNKPKLKLIKCDKN